MRNSRRLTRCPPRRATNPLFKPVNTYCVKGHRVAYADIKPQKCPTCGTAMEQTSITAAIAAIAGPLTSAATTTPQRWPDRPATSAPVQVEARAQISGDDDLSFDSPVRVTLESRPMTVEALARSEVAVERAEEGERSLGGSNENVSTRSLIDEMVAAAPALVAPAPSPRRQRAPRRSSAAAKAAQ